MGNCIHYKLWDGITCEMWNQRQIRWEHLHDAVTGRILFTNDQWCGAYLYFLSLASTSCQQYRIPKLVIASREKLVETNLYWTVESTCCLRLQMIHLHEIIYFLHISKCVYRITSLNQQLTFGLLYIQIKWSPSRKTHKYWSQRYEICYLFGIPWWNKTAFCCRDTSLMLLFRYCFSIFFSLDTSMVTFTVDICWDTKLHGHRLIYNAVP